MVIILQKLSKKEAYCKNEIVFIFLNDHIPDQFFAVQQKKKKSCSIHGLDLF